jgi:hypothetical protein
MVLRAFGRETGVESPSPLPLGEVTLVADAPTLREMATFLLHAADAMDAHGAAFGHEHFEDFVGKRAPEVMLVVAGVGSGPA